MKKVYNKKEVIEIFQIISIERTLIKYYIIRYAKCYILLRIDIDDKKSFQNHVSRIVNFFRCDI